MRKDSEEVLKIILEKRKEDDKDKLILYPEDFSIVPNFNVNSKNILDDLVANNCVSSNSRLYIDGSMMIYLTLDGISYFNNKVGEDKYMNNTNNFYATVNGIQFQQGTNNLTQSQTVSIGSFDYDKIANVIAQIKQYDGSLDIEFKDKAPKLREKLNKIEALVVKREEPSIIKQLLIDLKNLSIGISGSLIATGIVKLIEDLL